MSDAAPSGSLWITTRHGVMLFQTPDTGHVMRRGTRLLVVGDADKETYVEGKRLVSDSDVTGDMSTHRLMRYAVRVDDA